MFSTIYKYFLRFTAKFLKKDG